MRWASELFLRRCALASSLLHDVDAEPTPHGLRVQGPPPFTLSWDDVALAVGTTDSAGLGGLRLARWVAARSLLASQKGPPTPTCAVGLPVGHVLHPGPGWVVEQVHGDALQLGLGLVGLDPARPERALPLPVGVAAHAGLDTPGLWPPARAGLDRLATLAAARRARTPGAPLRPLGSADVVTLLGARPLRAALAGAEPDGLATVVAPTLVRGWSPATQVDPAFGPAAAALAAPAERGFARPLLVTAEEVVQVAPGGRPSALLLRGSGPRGQAGG